MEELLGKTVTIDGQAYRVEKLLGHGKGGYSYLVEREGKLFVLKAIHHEPCSYYQFGNKIEAENRDYKTLLEAGIPIPRMLFIDAEKEWILKEYINGPTIFDLVKDGADTTGLILQAKTIAEQAKSHGINIDYYPTNFIVSEGKLIYVDYECNPYMEEWDFDNWGVKYWSRTKEFLAILEKNS